MIPYQLRSFFRGLLKTVVILALVAILAGGTWLLWLNRYVIYTRDGAIIDLGISLEFPEGVVPEPPKDEISVDIFINENGNEEKQDNTDLKQFAGVYITADQLVTGIDRLEALIREVPASTPIMLDVKTIRGEFLYASEMGRRSDKVDTQRVIDLIRQIREQGNYLIARMPALRDYWYGLEHVNDGVFVPNQGSLWMDPDRCYWLHPEAEGTVTYLVQIITELRTLGVNEVVLYDFCVPDTQNIYFPQDRTETINKLADNLVKGFAGGTFAVSFCNSSETFQLPAGRTRLVLQNVAAAEAELVAARLNLPDPAVQLVFMTELMDTRFNDYSVLRPLAIPEA